MTHTFRSIAFACVFVSLIAGPAFGQSETVESLLDTISTRYDWIEYRLAQERWKLLTGEGSDSIAFFEDLQSHLISNPATLQKLKSVTSVNLSDDYRRKHQFFLQKGVAEAVAASGAVRPVHDSLLRAYATQQLKIDDQEVDSIQVAGRITYSNSRSTREQAHRTLYVGSEILSDQVESLIRLRNQEANRVGYNNYAALWFGHDAVSLDDYARILTEVQQVTEQAYDGLLARLRASLSGSLEVWDLDAAAGAARQREAAIFTEDTLYPVMHATLQSTGFSFDDLPIYYKWLDSGQAVPITAVLVRTPVDQRLVGILNPGHATIQRLLGQVGVSVYSAYVRESDPFFNRPAEGAMQTAIQRLFEMMSLRENWLTNTVGLPQSQAGALAATGRDRALIRIRLLTTLATFELEAYRNPNRDLNKVYWDIFDRIMKLPRHKDLHPWAARPGLVDRPFASGSELLGWLIAAQTWDYLKDFSGSVVQSRDTRAFLVQNYFRFGSRYTWPELLERGTGNSLSTDHIRVFITK